MHELSHNIYNGLLQGSGGGGGGGLVGPLIGQNRSLRVQITNPQCDKISPIRDLNYQFGHITPNWVFSLFPPNTYFYSDVLNLKCFQEK